MDELQSWAGNSTTGCQSTPLHSHLTRRFLFLKAWLKPWKVIGLQISWKLFISHLGVVYSKATPNPYMVQSTLSWHYSPNDYFVHTCVLYLWDRSQGPHSLKDQFRRKYLAAGRGMQTQIGEHMSAVLQWSPAVAQEGKKEVLPFNLSVQTTRPPTFSELAEHPPTPLT